MSVIPILSLIYSKWPPKSKQQNTPKRMRFDESQVLPESQTQTLQALMPFAHQN